MARELTSAAAAAAAASVVRPVLFFEGEYASGTLNLWSGIGTYDWDGKSWTGAGNLLGFGAIGETAELRAVGFEVSLSGEVASILSINLGQARQGLPGRAWLGFLAPYHPYVLADSPVAYWRLGESAGATTAVDASGNGLNGTYSGSPTLGVAGAIGNDDDTALKNNGTDSYVDCGNPPAFSFGTGSFSVEAWVTRLAGTGTNSPIVAKKAFSTAGLGFQLRHRLGARIEFTAESPEDSNFSAMSASEIDVGETVHVVGVVDRDQDTMFLYINGVEEASVDISTMGTMNNAVNLFLGRLHTDRTNNVTDEVALYNSALSAARVLAHYRAAVGLEGLGLIADPFKCFEGRFDVPDIVDDGARARLSARYESRLIDLDRARERKYTDQDQRYDYPDDGGMRHVAGLQDRPIYWGRLTLEQHRARKREAQRRGVEALNRFQPGPP